MKLSLSFTQILWICGMLDDANKKVYCTGKEGKEINIAFYFAFSFMNNFAITILNESLM